MEVINFSVANILAGLIFGTVGFVAFRYGRKQSAMKPMIVGAILMGYPYFISNNIALYAIGIALTVFLFIYN